MVKYFDKFRIVRATALLGAGLLAIGSITAAVAAPEDENAGELSLRAAPNVPMSGLFKALPDHARAIERSRERAEAARQAKGGGGCDKVIDVGDMADSPIGAARMVGGLDTGICTNSDIDTYTTHLDKTYVVIAGGTEAAWVHIDVTDPANPVLVTSQRWSGRAGGGTYTPDVKAFKQGQNYYIALGLERTKLSGACGVVIVDVTAPAAPVVVEQYINGADQAGDNWCDTHNVFVEKDGSGDGTYIYATADVTADLRVLSVHPANPDGGSVANPVEQGVYRSTQRNAATDSNTFNDVYVHDVTVENGVVYASYWLDGLHIFNADLIRGNGQTAIDIVNEAQAEVVLPELAPGSAVPFLTHHAYPDSTGAYVFVEDEITFREGDAPVQMYDISEGVATPLDGLVLAESGGDVPVIPAHNLEVAGNRLYVAWYKAGLQSWDFDAFGFTGNGVDPYSAAAYHHAQNKAEDGDYDGAWGVRVREIAAVPDGGVAAVTSTFVFQSDREFGLIVDCLGNGAGDLSMCPAQYVADSGGDDGGGKACNPKKPGCTTTN